MAVKIIGEHKIIVGRFLMQIINALVMFVCVPARSYKRDLFLTVARQAQEEREKQKKEEEMSNCTLVIVLYCWHSIKSLSLFFYSETIERSNQNFGGNSRKPFCSATW